MIRTIKTQSGELKEMPAAPKWRSFNAEFFKSQFSRSKQPPKRFLKKGLLTFATCMVLADEVFAQSTTSPWTQAVQAFAKPGDWLRLDSTQSKAIDSALPWHRLWEPIYSWQDERACNDDDWTNCLGVSDTGRFADFVLTACRENWGALLFAEESRAQSKGRFRDIS